MSGKEIINFTQKNVEVYFSSYIAEVKGCVYGGESGGSPTTNITDIDQEKAKENKLFGTEKKKIYYFAGFFILILLIIGVIKKFTD
jgi:hypothetical protein